MADYRLDDLGWLQFEHLAQALSKDVFGVEVEAWGGSSDGGRDAYHAGPLRIGLDPFDGPAVFQAKFVSGANAAGARPERRLRTAIQRERRAIDRRVAMRRWPKRATYVLITNAPVTGTFREWLADAMRDVAEPVLVWDGNDVARLLDSRPALRLAYPQILGLRDLSGLIQHAQQHPHIERAKGAHDRALELARVFAPVPAYYHALAALDRHAFVVLTGPPEMGKTSVGYMIGLAKMTDGWHFFPVEQPRDFFEIRQEDNAQVFLADDAFGSTEYRPDLAERWARELDHVLRRVDKRHWLIFTSRSAPLRSALTQLNLDGKAERFPAPAEVVVDTEELTVEAKAQILYRHAKSAQLSEPLKRLVRAHARPLVTNRHFTPERIRRYVNEGLPALEQEPAQLSADMLTARALEFVTNPTRKMRQSFEALPPLHKACLFALLEVEGSYWNGQAFRDAMARHTSITDGQQLNQLALQLGEHFVRFRATPEVPRSE